MARTTLVDFSFFLLTCRHSFWDQHTWMEPALLPFYPQLVTAGLQDRIDRLPEAAVTAKFYGNTGTKFPWESAGSGLFAEGPAIEDHLTADVVVTARTYYLATGDEAWLCDTALPLVQGVGEWLLSRVSPRPGGQWGISVVEPPNEFVVGVNDSVFTNAGAAVALDFAGRTLELCYGPGKMNASIAGLVTNFTSVAANMLLVFNASSNTHPDFAGEPWGATRKQADVTLLSYPVRLPMAPAVQQADLEYEMAVVNANGPAMSHAVFAIDWALLGNVTGAQDQLGATYLINTVEPYWLWVECPPPGCVNLRGVRPHQQSKVAAVGGVAGTSFKESLALGAAVPCLNFITGAGGFLQAVANGFMGIQFGNGSLTLSPIFPPNNVTALEARGLQYMGATFDIVLSNGDGGNTSTAVVSVKLNACPLPRGGGACTFTWTDADGGQHQLNPGAQIQIPATAARPSHIALAPS